MYYLIYFIFTKITNYVRNLFYLKLLDFKSPLSFFYLSLSICTTQMLYARLCYTFAAIVNQKSAPTMRFPRIDTEGKHDTRLFILLSLRFDKFSSLYRQKPLAQFLSNQGLYGTEGTKEKKSGIEWSNRKQKHYRLKKSRKCLENSASFYC